MLIILNESIIVYSLHHKLRRAICNMVPPRVKMTLSKHAEKFSVGAQGRNWLKTTSSVPRKMILSWLEKDKTSIGTKVRGAGGITGTGLLVKLKSA